MRLFPIFEGFTPFFIFFFLRRILAAWKTKGLINGYQIKTTRLFKFNYKIELRISLTASQEMKMLDSLIGGIIITTLDDLIDFRVDTPQD